MNETLTVTTERVDDIPLLMAQLEKMGLAELLDQHFPTHGNWRGLSLGATACIWLCHILSQADHRLNQVQPWVERRLFSLQQALGQPLRSLDLTDDRLASLLWHLNADVQWADFELALNQRTLRVYDLRPKQVRLDTTSASGYWQVSEDGLFQFGHSKDHRPDLPQLKVMLATLDPLGLPLVTDVLAGQQADDPAYLPAIARVRDSLEQAGLLYIGDCKMAALLTRATLAAGRDFYLCPLSALQLPQQELLALLATCQASNQLPSEIVRLAADGSAELIAEGYEQSVPLTAQLAGATVQWQERRLVVYSFQAAHAAEQGLHKRLAQAEQELSELTKLGKGKRRIASLAELELQATAVLKRQRVEGLLLVHGEEEVQTRAVRGYKDAASRQVEERQLRLEVSRDEAAIRGAVQALGWRVYVTNAPAAELSLEQAVLAYREEYLVERSFGRLKGQPLSLTPMYLERDEHATGLVRLLSIGLRVLSLLEYEVRRRLAAAGGVLAGLYAGNPTRATARPTAEGLLGSFKEITLTIIEQAGQRQLHLTPLSGLQQRVLSLLGFSPAIYLRLVEHSLQPP